MNTILKINYKPICECVLASVILIKKVQPLIVTWVREWKQCVTDGGLVFSRFMYNVRFDFYADGCEGAKFVLVQMKYCNYRN